VGWPAKGQFPRRIENAHAIIRAGLCRWQQERCLGKAQPAGQRQHGITIKRPGAMNHRERIAGKRSVGKDIDQI